MSSSWNLQQPIIGIQYQYLVYETMKYDSNDQFVT